ncbi:MAG: GAF domain-containing protein, partial [Pseudomonadota bacterium]
MATDDSASDTPAGADSATGTGMQTARADGVAPLVTLIRGLGDDPQPLYRGVVAAAVEVGDACAAALLRSEDGQAHRCARVARTDSQAHTDDTASLEPVTSAVVHRVTQERETVLLQGADARAQAPTWFVDGVACEQLLFVPITADDGVWGALQVAWSDEAAVPASVRREIDALADLAGLGVETVQRHQALATADSTARAYGERETASRDILDVISRRRDDENPVFDVVLRHAVELCKADAAAMMLGQVATSTLAFKTYHEGTRVQSQAEIDALEDIRRSTLELDPAKHISAQAICEARVVHVDDLSTHPSYLAREPTFVTMVELNEERTALSVPLLRDGVALGAINVYRRRVEAFQAEEIALVEAFAAQAVIAIDNVRQFRELGEALEQQTATADVLRTISEDAFDLPTVLQALITTAAQLCDAPICILFDRRDGAMHMGANIGCSDEMVAFHTAHPNPIDRSNVAGRAVLDKQTVHVPDVTQDPNYTLTQSYRLGGWRSIIAVPLLRNDEVIAVLALSRPRIGPFSARQIDLVESFADQAVIAINNATLFAEVQERTAEVSQALEYQTATSDVLEVISRSPDDVDPVLESILAVSAALCKPQYSYIALLDSADGCYHVRRSFGVADEFIDFLTRNPIRPGTGSSTGRAALLCETVYIRNTETDDSYTWKEASRRGGYLSSLAVPLVQSGKCVGVIALADEQPDAYSDKQIALLETFSAQAVIALNNTRMFHDTQAALARQTASADVLRVISQSPTDTTPVFEMIVTSATQLVSSDLAIATLANDTEWWQVALASPEGLITDFATAPHPIDEQHNFHSAVLVSGKTMHVPDLSTADLPTLARRLHEESGFQAYLHVPLLRDER